MTYTVEKNTKSRKGMSFHLGKLALLLPLLFLLGCSGSDDGGEAVRSGKINAKFAVQGNRVNGNFEVSMDSINQVTVTPTAVYAPEKPEEGEGAKLFLNIVDFDKGLGFSTVLPAAEALTEIIKDNAHDYQLALHFEGFALEAGTVSVHLTELDVDPQFNFRSIKHMKGNFEGVVLHIETVGGQTIEEPHTVTGEFEYNRP